MIQPIKEKRKGQNDVSAFICLKSAELFILGSQRHKGLDLTESLNILGSDDILVSIVVVLCNSVGVRDANDVLASVKIITQGKHKANTKKGMRDERVSRGKE